MSTLSIERLREAIKALLEAHPAISLETTSRGVHLKVYRTTTGLPIGHVHENTTMQGIWVRRDSVRLDRLKAISHEVKTELALSRARESGKQGRNSNLETVAGFKDEALIYFRVFDLAEVARIIEEVVS